MSAFNLTPDDFKQLNLEKNDLTAEDILKLQPYQLQKLGEILKSRFNIENTRDLNVKLIDNIDQYENIVKKNWKESIKDIANYISKGKSTLPTISMIKAGQIIGQFLLTCLNLNKLTGPIKIIEPLAANGVASKNIFNEIKSKINDLIYVASDIQNLSHLMDSNSYDVEFDIDCVDSINKHQEGSEILLLVSPPPYSYDPNSGIEPNGFVDYFAIKQWTRLNKKILIYIGEMGSSDGTSGMYHYMMNHPIWKLKFSKVLVESPDIFGRMIQKEIYIYFNSLIIDF